MDDDDDDDDDDIYLLQIAFHPLAAIGKPLKKIGKRQIYTK